MSQIDANPPSCKNEITKIKNDDFCRICGDLEKDDNPLMQPCKCKGTIKHIHKICLKKSIESSKNLNCPICKASFKNLKITIRLPGRLSYAKLYPHYVLFYSALFLFIFFNLIILIKRDVEFYTNKFYDLDSQLTQIRLNQRKLVRTIKDDDYLDRLIDSRFSAFQKADTTNLNHFNRSIQRFKVSVHNLLNTLSIILLRFVRMLSNLNDVKYVLFLNFSILTVFYLINDLVQFATIFIIVCYLYKDVQNHYILWKARNSVLIVGFEKL